MRYQFSKIPQEILDDGKSHLVVTSPPYGDHGTIEYFVDSLGDDRILYGSDVPLIDPRFGVGRIATANISTESKRKILGLNALKVLNLKESEVIG